MGKKVGTIGGVVVALAFIVGLICLAMSIEKVPVGYEGVVYSMNGGVQEETLSSGWHIVAPTKKVKEFTISNEQLILTQDKRDGSENDESFKVATSDDASISVSFQMSYCYKPETIVATYKKFKGMDGEDIVNKRIKTVLKSKVSEITTVYSMMDIYSGNRSEINNKITEYLNNEFADTYGISIIDASIIDVHPDNKLKEAIDNRVTALQQKQQAEAEQEKIKVEAETAKIQAEKEANIKRIQAQADADVTKTKAKAEAEANKELAKSITKELIDMKTAEARLAHGWVEITGSSTVVTENK